MASFVTNANGFLATLAQDIRYSGRLLLKSKGFTIAAILSLALGIGANTTIFSIVNSVFLRPLPFNEPQSLVYIWASAPERGVRMTGNSWPKFQQYQEQQQVFSEIAAQSNTRFTLTGQGDPALVQGALVTSQFFRVLGIAPQRGREFSPEEDRPGGAQVALISNGCWQRRFGGDPSVVGKSLTLNGVSYTVVGILPAELSFPYDRIEVFTPRVPESPDLSPEQIERGSGFLQIIGRLKPGVTVAQSQGSLSVITDRYRQAFPGNVDANFSVIVRSFQDNLTGSTRPIFIILFGAVAFVLLISCANVTTLMLARFTGRSREIAVRAALGASRARIIQQFLVESLLLSLTGGILGAIFGILGVPLLVSFGQEFIPRAQEVKVDYLVLLFTLGISLMTGLLIGLLPAIQTSKSDLNSVLKESSRGATGGVGRERLRKLMVTSEISLSLILLIGAALLISSFFRLQTVPLGFEPDNLSVLSLDLPAAKYKEPESRAAFFDQLIERLSTTPGVKGATAASGLPVSGTNSTVYAVIGQTIPEISKRPLTDVASVTPTYFGVMGIPIVSGRNFAQSDRPDTSKVVIISNTMAQRVFAGQDPIGQQLLLGSQSTESREIIGVAGDVRPTLTDNPREHVYYPMLQRPQASMAVVVRGAIDEQALLPSLRDAVRMIDSNQPITSTMTMQELIEDSISGRRMSMILLSIFAGLAMFTAAIGLSSTISYMVAQRNHEIGIRMALGAQSTDVLKLIMRQGLFLVLIGLLVGLVGAFALTQVMSSMLFGVTAAEPRAFLIIALLLGAVALLACYLPARRATKIEPTTALRYE